MSEAMRKELERLRDVVCEADAESIDRVLSELDGPTGSGDRNSMKPVEPLNPADQIKGCVCEIVQRLGKDFKPCGAPAVARADVVGNVCEHHCMLALIAGFKPVRFNPTNEKGEP